MPHVTTSPNLLAATAGDLAAIASTMRQASAAAAAPTAAVQPAGGDIVSAGIASLFGAHAYNYQVLSAKAAEFHDRFVEILQTSAQAYGSTEATNASPLEKAIGVFTAPAEGQAGGPGTGNGAFGGGLHGGAGGFGDVGQPTANAAPVGPAGATAAAGTGGSPAQATVHSGSAAGNGDAASVGTGVQHGGAGGGSGDGMASSHVSDGGAARAGGAANSAGGTDVAASSSGAGGGGSAGQGVASTGGDHGAGATSSASGHSPGHGVGLGSGLGRSLDGYGTAALAGGPLGAVGSGAPGAVGGVGELSAPTATSALPTAASATAEPSLAMSTKAQLVHATNPLQPVNPAHSDSSANQGGPARRTGVERDGPTLFLPLTSLRGLRRHSKKRSGLRAQSGRLRDSGDAVSSPRWEPDDLLRALGLRPPGHQ
ncbi:PE family protein [Mycobacterium marinum]|uniref:PE family protein n=1 Tax=Mycobacterium marinum TaxID=1781 RepID=UPI000B976141|nr:PE family protein [Mycobacterium marinum]MDC8984233.1 PE family protein [Mycobacterium marinum]MDC8995469.1 PE family protein [Mycobacterium marinum]MDC9001389.1 PE family protein [Mycobacterium marinum]MDC9011920.1 PE family protein [Mycobacterium marinum]MDC9017521.1 PE family protein [Mycobacterium marinum]